MQEQMNKAMASLNEAVGDDVPDARRGADKIEARYAKAKAVAELNDSTVDASMLEIEEATANVEAQARLSELRAELGLAARAKQLRRLAHGDARRARVRSGRPPGLSREHHEVVAVDGLVGHVGREVAACAGRPCAAGRGLGGRHPAGEDGAVASGDVERVALVELTDHLDARRPAAATSPRSTSGLAGAVVDDEVARRSRWRTRSRACGPAAAGRWPRTSCRRPATPATASASTSGRSARAMTARTPDHEAIRAAASLDAMPPLPRAEPVPPATTPRIGSSAGTCAISVGVGVAAGVGA